MDSDMGATASAEMLEAGKGEQEASAKNDDHKSATCE